MIKKLKIKLTNAYGIPKLEKEFNFEKTHSFIIYAPNGVMKTSFAKTFRDFSQGNETKDQINPDKKTSVEIFVDENEMAKETVVVVSPYDTPKFSEQKMLNLLINESFKKEYLNILKEIDKIQINFFNKIKESLKLNKNFKIDEKIKDDFGTDFSKLIKDKEIQKQVEEGNEQFHDVEYSTIFGVKSSKFLETKNAKKHLLEYKILYKNLIEKSPILSSNFNLWNAAEIQKSLNIHNFFKNGHQIKFLILNPENNEKFHTIHNSEEFKSFFEEEEQRVLQSPESKKIFNEMFKNANKNEELRNLMNYLDKKPNIPLQLNDLNEFKKKIWIAVFVKYKDLFFKLVKVFEENKEKFEKIADQCQKEKTKWDSVLTLFNQRFFHVPFTLELENKKDSILGEVPIVNFVYENDKERKKIDQNTLFENILSTGEKRVLYILDILFEVENRKIKNKTTLFVFDDAVDSFDYKNKYAITEYLQCFSENKNFYMLFLTHNFDFFRTLMMRFYPKPNSFFAIRKNEEIQLKKSDFLVEQPFSKWREHLEDPKKFIASIPFLRNIIEYTEGNKTSNYSLLTSLLHIRKDTEKITGEKIWNIFEKVYCFKNIKCSFEKEKILDLIYKTATKIGEEVDSMDLSNMIVLSLAIRLKAEKFIFDKCSRKEYFEFNQTREFVKRYKDEFKDDSEKIKNIEILERVLLITSSNIHINSFMYEPIIDMGMCELKELYENVKKLE